jgi:hypothetical protein
MIMDTTTTTKVTSAYSQRWIDLAKEMGGRWDAAARAWIIPGDAATVRQAIIDGLHVGNATYGRAHAREVGVWAATARLDGTALIAR